MQRVLQFLESNFQSLARYLARVAPRLCLEETVLPDFVAGLESARVEFQGRKQHSIPSKLVVYLRVLFQEFVDYRLVVHIGSLQN